MQGYVVTLRKLDEAADPVASIEVVLITPEEKEARECIQQLRDGFLKERELTDEDIIETRTEDIVDIAQIRGGYWFRLTLSDGMFSPKLARLIEYGYRDAE